MAELKGKNKIIFEYAVIIIGVMLLAVAVTVFLEPLNLVTGGVSGLGIIIESASETFIGYKIPLWVSNAVLNLPLFIVGTKVRGWKFLQRTLFATVFFSAALYITAFIPKLQDIDILLSAVFGGVFSGLGLGLVFRCAATTGGSDLAASIINKYMPHIALAKIMFVIDALIIMLGFFVFGATKTMYAIIAVYIATRVIEAVLEGLNFAKAAFIISDEYEAVSEALLTKLDRGVTALHGKGMYTRSEKSVVLCVVSTKEIVSLKEIVYSIDEKAFVIVADVREVLGEGFKAAR